MRRNCLNDPIEFAIDVADAFRCAVLAFLEDRDVPLLIELSPHRPRHGRHDERRKK